jgi:hypothetical protein
MRVHTERLGDESFLKIDYYWVERWILSMCVAGLVVDGVKPGLFAAAMKQRHETVATSREVHPVDGSWMLKWDIIIKAKFALVDVLDAIVVSLTMHLDDLLPVGFP